MLLVAALPIEARAQPSALAGSTSMSQASRDEPVTFTAELWCNTTATTHW